MTTKAQQTERDEAIEKLPRMAQAWRHGLYDPAPRFTFWHDTPYKRGGHRRRWRYDAPELGGSESHGIQLNPMGHGYDAVIRGGCGMDMGFDLVYSLSRALFPSYQCLGRRYKDENGPACPSNDHVNPGPHRDNFGAAVVHTDGYALSQRWL